MLDEELVEVLDEEVVLVLLLELDVDEEDVQVDELEDDVLELLDVEDEHAELDEVEVEEDDDVLDELLELEDEDDELLVELDEDDTLLELLELLTEDELLLRLDELLELDGSTGPMGGSGGLRFLCGCRRSCRRRSGFRSLRVDFFFRRRFIPLCCSGGVSPPVVVDHRSAIRDRRYSVFDSSGREVRGEPLSPTPPTSRLSPTEACYG